MRKPRFSAFQRINREVRTISKSRLHDAFEISKISSQKSRKKVSNFLCFTGVKKISIDLWSCNRLQFHMLLGIVKSISQFLRPKKFPRVVISAHEWHHSKAGLLCVLKKSGKIHKIFRILYFIYRYSYLPDPWVPSSKGFSKSIVFMSIWKKNLK